MRRRYAVTLAAGGRWPDVGDSLSMPRFNWVKIDNKGSASVDVSLNANPTAGDKIDTLFTVGNGKVRTLNVAGPHPPGSDHPDAGEGWPDIVHLVSASGTTVVVELADHPIVDMEFAT